MTRLGFTHNFLIYFVCVLALAFFSSCSPRALYEAHSVVAEADSLWREGLMYSDSAKLAEAYNILDAWQWFYADDYAHACYHYGRLLREKEDPVAAMQAFINATHTRTHDYHILGRVFSNMGDIAHMAEKYLLSYEMFKISTDMFLKNGDTILYYYGLNNIAFELAVQGKKDESYAILSQIATSVKDINMIALTIETKAEACLYSQQYDSAIYYTSQILAQNYYEHSCLLIRAQAYSFAGIKDSAVFYAKQVLQLTHSLPHTNNALYILTNDDEEIDKDNIRCVAAKRADTQKLLERRQAKLSQAVQLLEQNMKRKPNLSWLYASLITVLFIGSAFYWRNKIRKRQMQNQIEQIIEKQADSITQSIKQHIDTTNLNQTMHWKNYEAMKADADLYMGGIVSKLEIKNLNETEIRFCILTILNFTLLRIADTIHYSYPSGIKTLKKRISIKLETTPPNLRDFLFHLAVNA